MNLGTFIRVCSLTLLVGGLVWPVTEPAAFERPAMPGQRSALEGEVRPDDRAHERRLNWQHRLGARQAWRDYQRHMQKHYRILEKYGGIRQLPPRPYGHTFRPAPAFDRQGRSTLPRQN